MPSANDLTRKLLVTLPERLPGARCWRRNTGGGYPVATVQRALGMLRAGQASPAIAFLAAARPIAFGLAGEPDVDGFLPLETPAGPLGVRVGIEIKGPGDRLRDTQKVCRSVYERGGCIYLICHDVERAIAELEAVRQQLQARISPGARISSGARIRSTAS